MNLSTIEELTNELIILDWFSVQPLRPERLSGVIGQRPSQRRSNAAKSQPKSVSLPSALPPDVRRGSAPPNDLLDDLCAATPRVEFCGSVNGAAKPRLTSGGEAAAVQSKLT